MRYALFVALVAFLVVGADEKQSDGKKDLDLLQGEWTIVSVERNGKTNNDAAGGKFTFDGDNIVIQLKDEQHKGTFKLDASKKPKQIDLTPLDGPDKDKVLAGIYSLTKDELKICISHPAGADRPKEFESKEGSGLGLVTLKRTK